jgi:hypothetical protein
MSLYLLCNAFVLLHALMLASQDTTLYDPQKSALA